MRAKRPGFMRRLYRRRRPRGDTQLVEGVVVGVGEEQAVPQLVGGLQTRVEVGAGNKMVKVLHRPAMGTQHAAPARHV